MFVVHSSRKCRRHSSASRARLCIRTERNRPAWRRGRRKSRGGPHPDCSCLRMPSQSAQSKIHSRRKRIRLHPSRFPVNAPASFWARSTGFHLPRSNSLGVSTRNCLVFAAAWHPRALRLQHGEEGSEAIDIEFIGQGLGDRMNQIVKELHAQVELPEGESIAELVVADFIPGYGPEVWHVDLFARTISAARRLLGDPDEAPAVSPGLASGKGISRSRFWNSTIRRTTKSLSVLEMLRQERSADRKTRFSQIR